MDTSPSPALLKTHYWLPLSRPLRVWTLSYHPPNCPPFLLLVVPRCWSAKLSASFPVSYPAHLEKPGDNSSSLVGARYV